MSSMRPPQSPLVDDNGRVRREWLFLFNDIIRTIVEEKVAELMALFPDPGSALADLARRVEDLELQVSTVSLRSEIDPLRAEIEALQLQQAMRSDAAEPARRPVNG